MQFSKSEHALITWKSQGFKNSTMVLLDTSNIHQIALSFYFGMLTLVLLLDTITLTFLDFRVTMKHTTELNMFPDELCLTMTL